MSNHALPTTTSLYTDVLTNLKDRIDDSLKMLDSVNTTPTNVPTNSIRWNSTTTLWEKYNGSSWISLAASYAIKVLKSSNLVGGNSTTLLGSIPYQSNTDTTTLLAPNTTTTRKFLRQTGSGTNGSAPVWDTILASDVPTLNQNTTGNAATATTATNVNGGTVNATTGTFSGELATETQIVIGTGGDNRRGAIYSDVNWGMFFRAKVDTPNMAHFVWMKGDGSELFRHNGTALTTNITGNSGTSTALVGDETNWTSYRSRSVANMLGWKNYGNGYVIFDASNGTAPNGVAVNNTNPNTPWSPTYPTLMGWNGSKTFGVRVDSARVADSATSAPLAQISDISSAIANTSFVYRAQGNLKLQSGVLGNVTLTQELAGSLLIFNGTPTLPAPYAVRSGTCFYLCNSTSAAIGIALNGNSMDTDYPLMRARETLVIQSDGGSYYRIVSRSRNTASSFSSAGYVELETGIILQWGSATDGTTVVFPIAFPHAVFNVTISPASLNNGLPRAVSKTLSGFTVNYANVAGGTCNWYAIGY